MNRSIAFRLALPYKRWRALVYLQPDGKNVVKTNDAAYYATWMEYFNSLVLHNLLFPNTAYTLLGFAQQHSQLVAVLQQPFILGGQAMLDDIEAFLNYNGFDRIKRQDYRHKNLPLILEDMHDENVILSHETLFFIDTVFTS